MFPFPFLPPYKVHATYVRSAIAMYILHTCEVRSAQSRRNVPARISSLNSTSTDTGRDNTIGSIHDYSSYNVHHFYF